MQESLEQKAGAAAVEDRTGHPGELEVPGTGSAEEWRGCGRMMLAERAYEKAVYAFKRSIHLEPGCAASYFGLGIALGGSGKEIEAIDAYRNALSIKADYPEVWNNLGNILEKQGNPAEAEACFERAIGVDPCFVIGVNNLGLLQFRLGRLTEAAALFRRALTLEPNLPDVWDSLGRVLCRLGEFEKGVSCLRYALALEPDRSEIHYHLGLALTEWGKEEEAIAAYRGALAARPDYPEALNELGGILESRGKLVEAGVCFERAVQVNPGFAVAVHNLGGVQFKLGRLTRATELFRKAVALQPDFAEAFNSLGAVLRLQNAFDESLVCCRRAVALRPNYPEALLNLGNTLCGSGRLNEAISTLQRALETEGDDPLFHLNLGLFLLAAGRFDEGWPEHEWRWHHPDLAPTRPRFSEPIWRGEPAENSVLLLHAEQGLGDTIQFCRYAPLAAMRGLRVVLMVQPVLVGLLRSLPGVERVISQSEVPPAFDLQCPLMSLPLAFDTRLGDIPADIPYLFPQEDLVRTWQERLQSSPSGCMKVGLVWEGSAREHSPAGAATNRRRSIAPEMLAPLIEVRGIQFYSLQKGGPSAPTEFGLIDFMEECRDFADTAALVANLDLVVSVDTAAVHLAGALGKPVWVLNRFDSCWRWLQDREDSPWYPTLRLFRQPRPGDWKSVVARVRDELDRLCSA